MLLIQETIDTFGYDPRSKKPRSNCLAIFKCDGCQEVSPRKINQFFNKSRHLCKACYHAEFKEKTIARFKQATPEERKSWKEKQEATTFKNHGVKHPLQSKEILSKVKNTCVQRYGVTSPAKNSEVKNKTRSTCLQKYGVGSTPEVPEIAAKMKQTNMERYGAEHVFNLPEFQEKCKEGMARKYGVNNPMKSELIRAKAKSTSLEKYGFEYPSMHPEVRDKTIATNQLRYGSNYPHNFEGKTQKELAEWISSVCALPVDLNTRLPSGKELDVSIPGKKLAIEYCGLFWHTEDSLSPRKKDYHVGKLNECMTQGVRLITIFEDEWLQRKDQCKGFLKSVLGLGCKVYARKCVVKELTKKEGSNFIEQHHIQGKNSLGIVYFGIFHAQELLGVMSLGRHHRKSKEIVLDRLAFIPDVSVLGGASKLFSAARNWMKSNKYSKVVSWSDNRWSEGGVYRALGFTLAQELPPDYSYVLLKRSTNRLSKQSQKKSSSKCPEGMTELQWANERGLSRIWDCGKKRWECILEDV